MFNIEIEYTLINEEIFQQFGCNDIQNTVSLLTDVGMDVVNLLPLNYTHLP